MKQLLLLFSFVFPWSIWAQLTCEDEFILTGSANLQGECIQMTPNANGQQGCAWFNEETDFSMPFSHVMTVNFGSSNSGADGICLVYQSNNNSICGISGEGIGAQGIPNSFIVEFDTYQNGNLGDPFNDHAAININGDFTTNIDGPVDLGNIEDGNDYEVTFNWDPATNTYEVYFDGALIMSGVYDIITNCFGGSPLAFWGYTSSTGGQSNEHLVCPGLPPEVIADAGALVELPCIGALGMLDGSGSDSGPEFTYEWTTSNGNIVSGDDTDSPTIDEAGTYTLTVYNTITLCESMDVVNVVVNSLVAEIETPQYLDCISGEVVLSGSNSSSGPNITYQWTTSDGNIVETNGDEATVDEAGEYTLTVLYDDGQGTCMEEATILVEDNPDVPVAFAVDELLTCDPPSVELDGTGSSESSVFDYEWTTDDGEILAGETTLFPLVGAGGTYTLLVTNSISGCTDEYSIFVTADQDIPDAIAIVDDDLGCGGSSITIDGSLSSFGDEFTYDWTTSNGNIVSGSTEQSPVVDEPGNYTLLVTDTDNGCTDQTTVTVTGGTNPVDVTIDDPPALTCISGLVVLDGSSSAPGSGVTYQWSTTNGQFQGATDEALVDVIAPGDYTLTVVETATNCMNTATVTVVENTTPPLAEAGMATAFGCGDTSQQLNGAGSSVGNVTYSWSTGNGMFIGGTNTLTPTVGTAGTYSLLVTNNTNGCTATDQVVVPSDDDTPVIQMVVSDTLDCNTGSLTIDATGSSSGMEYNMGWSTTDGSFVSGEDGLQPIVDQAGTYTLTITNTTNDCSNNFSIAVVQDTLHPIAQIALPDTLDCVLTSLELDGSNSTNGSTITYLWSTSDGQVDTAVDSLQAGISSGGTYNLLVENTSNGCQDLASIMVVQDTLVPDVSILPTIELNCTEVLANVQSSLGAPIASPLYQWATMNGTIIGSNTTDQIVVDAPGLYVLNVINTANQCSSTASIQVNQDITPPLANAGPDHLLTCENDQQVLGGASSSGPEISYEWTSPDVPLSAADTLASLSTWSPGTFSLQVLNNNNNCIAFDTVLVSQDTVSPVAVVAPPNLLTCTDSLSVLDGSASSGAANLSFSWTTMNGSLVGNPSSSQLNAGQAGTYQLVVSNMDNGCRDTAGVVVLQDDNFPQATIAMPADLTCVQTSVTLSGMANSASGNTSFSWTTSDGNIIADEDSLQPIVDEAGTYTLTVEDTNNNCRAQAEIQVALDDVDPIAVAGPDTLLNCVQTQIELDAGSSDQGANITYGWSTTDGAIDAGEGGQTPTVSAGGIYTLLVTNTTNGCTATDALSVSVDTLAPNIQIAVPLVLTCADTLVDLDASASTAGTDPLFVWTSPDGNPIMNSGGALAVASLSGTYDLLLTNSENGCTSTEAVIVNDNLTPPTPAILEPDTLDCVTPTVALDASGSNGNGSLSYNWSTTDGSILSNGTTANPVVEAEGEYSLQLIDNSNGCASMASVVVMEDVEPPLITIDTPISIDCNNPNIVLQAFIGSNVGTAPQYEWSSPNGNILMGEDGLTPTVDQGGFYTVLITNTDNGCTGQDDVLVREDITPPTAVIEPVDTLNCTNSMVLVDAVNSIGDGALDFDWNTTDGNIISNPSEISIMVDAAGIYEIILTDQSNGCMDSLSVEIQQDTIAPVISIGLPDILDCSTPSVFLDGSGSSSGPTFQLEWTTVDGQIDAGENGLMPEVSEPGFYTFSVLNTINSCSSEAMVEVSQDEDVPVIVFAEPAELNCMVLSTGLDASESSMGMSLSYSWTTTDGVILNGADGLLPEVGAPGAYTLLIEDSGNGCSNTAVLNVLQDITPPVAEAGVNFTLDCTSPIDFLNGGGSSQGAHFIYAWTGLNGEPVNDAGSLIASISEPGTYQLLVTNTDNGCSANDIVNAIQNIPEAVLESLQPLCFGDHGAIAFAEVQGGTPPYLFTIDGGNSLQTQQSYFNLPAGEYLTQVEDSNGCLYEELVELVQPDSLIVQITESEIEINYGDSIRLLAQTNYPVSALTHISWEDAATLSCDDCLQPYAQPTQSGLYRISVISENGCKAEALVRILVNKDFPIYFPSGFSPDGDGTNDFFYPFAGLGSVKEVRQFAIFDRWGNEVYTVGRFQPNDPRYGWDGTRAGVPYKPAVFVYFAEVEWADGRIEIFKGDVVLVR